MGCNKCTTVMKDVANGEGCAFVGGEGVYGNFVYFLLNFALNLELL